MSNQEQLPAEKQVRHASRLDDSKQSLCGESPGYLTRPRETINCPTCRVILNHVRDRYAQDGYSDRRLTKDEMRQAAREMYADLVGGDIEG
jgi:hypothetical protein